MIALSLTLAPCLRCPGRVSARLAFLTLALALSPVAHAEEPAAAPPADTPPAISEEQAAASAVPLAPAGEAGQYVWPAVVLDEVVVIGTRAQGRTVHDSPVPVDVFSGQGVETASATGEVGQVLQALAPSINFPRVSVSGSSDSVRPVILRGLAPDQVLVLVNGKRRHVNAVLATEGPFVGTVPVDVNAIPASAIERIEVLRDGAGAQYGSDAVAGVINIVLKETPEGAQVTARYGQRHTHVDPQGITSNDGKSGSLSVDGGLALGEHGRLHVGADYTDSRATNRSGPAFYPNFGSDPTPPADQALEGRVLYASGDPDQRNLSAFYDGAVPLLRGELYSFATVSGRDSVGAAFFRWPTDAGNVPALHPEGFRPRTTLGSIDWDVVAGWRRTAGSWSVDLSLRNGYNRARYGVKGSLNSSLGEASPSTFHLADFRSIQTGVDAEVTRFISVDGLAGPVVLAFGAALGHERYDTFAGDLASYQAGSNLAGLPGAQAGPGLRPEDAVGLSRVLGAVYVDASSDLTSRLLLDVAARGSAYQGAGGGATGKAAARFKLVDGLLVRASVSNSFRAPALAQTGFRLNTLNFNADGSALVRSAFLPPSDPAARLVGAKDLKPETSVNLSGGLDYTLGAGFSAGVDAYQISIKDRITHTSDLDSDAVRAALAPTDIQTLSFLTNAIDSTTRGLDVVLSSEQSVAGGSLTLSGAFNYNVTRFDRVRSTTPELTAIDPTVTLFSDRELFTARHGSPKSKLILSADWSGHSLGLSASVTRYGSLGVGTFDDSLPVIEGANVQSYAADWTTDAEARYTLGGLTVALGANNLFDRYPAQQAAGNTFFGALPYSFYPPLGFNGRYIYTRVTYRF